MKAAVEPHLVERFRAVLGRQTGLAFDEQRLGFLGDVLMRRLARLGRSGEAYLAALEHGKMPDEIAVLARELTVPETYFFRHNDQFRALADRVLPERMGGGRPVKTLSILSAGCATGEEAYSLAMIMREAIDDPAWDVRIRAVDLSPAALEKASRGRYTAWSLRETNPARRRRWFRDDGNEVVLDESIRRAVRFEQRNLSVEDAELWSPGAYDVVFCRNVLMYFEPPRMRQAIDRIARSLAPGGFLFLGHAETLRGVSEDFHLCHTHDAFYYQRKGTLHPPAAVPPVSAPARIVAEAALQLDGAFVDAIRSASERVAALMPGAAEAAAAPSWDAAPALDLLRRERFAEALQAVQARPAALARDPDLLLLEAMLLTHDGKIAVAADSCRTLLAVDELNAGAHYVLALCGEHAGALEDAAEHDRIAAYLDPGFAMPRLHLGLLARRAGQREAARRELTQALFLLEREDPSRLLLFGGGFNREALMGLCNLALKDCGGRA